MQKDLRWQSSNTLTYKKKINKKNTFDIMLGHEFSFRSSELLYGQSKDFPFPNLGNDNLGIGATPSSVSTSRSDKKLLSYFARGNYNFDNRYLLTVNFRADGSSAVVLVEGSVAIDVANGESVTLNPSERFSMKDGSYSVYEVDPYKYISWKDGLLFFTSNTLFEVLQKVAAFYKIEITCFGEIGSRKCTGKLILFDDLDGTLDVLSDIFRIAYVRGPDGSVAVRPAPDDCADAVYR